MLPTNGCYRHVFCYSQSSRLVADSNDVGMLLNGHGLTFEEQQAGVTEQRDMARLLVRAPIEIWLAGMQLDATLTSPQQVHNVAHTHQGRVEFSFHLYEERIQIDVEHHPRRWGSRGRPSASGVLPLPLHHTT